jgi:repressor LexA
MEPLGTKIRRRRRALGLSLDKVAALSGISKPYLSLIETGRYADPPSDAKLRGLERALEFTPGELLSQAHLMRTPADVRSVLEGLLLAGREPAAREPGRPAGPRGAAGPVNLDAAWVGGVLQDLVERISGNVERLRTRRVPVINKVSAGYPRDFTDLSYPQGVADDYVVCADVDDPQAFAARVHGDSMAPAYQEGDIVIFAPAADPRDGDDCFIRFEDGQTTFKRVFFEDSGGEDGRRIRLQPRNPRYQPQVVPAGQITGIYRAVFKYQRL